MPRPVEKLLLGFRGDAHSGACIPRSVHRLTQATGQDANRLSLTNTDGVLFEAVWIQVARAGTFRGHASGKTFTLDESVFSQLIGNFRAHRSYVANDNGVGIADVVAFDYHHESEKSGSIAVATVGAPAQAWALDLEMRAGVEGLELWALTRYLEPARTQVREGGYKWTSVAIWPNAKHPETGEPIGWYLSSIAFTNDPFIQGMQPIAASASRGEVIKLDDDRVIGEFRWIFNLSEVDGLPAVVEQLARLRAYVADPTTAPTGVDVAKLVGRLRDLLNLPLTTPDAEVFGAADEVVRQLNDATPQPPSTTAGATPATRKETSSMNPKLLALAGRLGCESTPDALAAQVNILLERDQSMRAKLAAFAKALKVENPDEAIGELEARLAEMDELRAALPELDSLRAQQGEDEEEDAEKEVTAAMRHHNMADVHQPMMAYMRTGGVALPRKRDKRGHEVLDVGHPEFGAKLQARREARANFLASYPVPAAGQEHLLVAHATRTPIASGPPRFSSPLLNSMGSRAPGMPPPGPGPSPGAPGQLPALDLSESGPHSGRNVTERAMSLVRSSAGGDALDHETVHAQACAIVKAQREAGHLN